MVKDTLDMAMICCRVEDTNLLFVRTEPKDKNLKDLIKVARKNT